MTCFYKFPNKSFYDSLEKPESVDEIGNFIISEEIINEESIFTFSNEYHVNTIWPVPEWEEYRIYPNTPMRIIG